MIAVSNIMKRKIKKIFYEVISNSKILNIFFFNENVNDQDFPKLTGGLDSVEYGTLLSGVCLRFYIFIHTKILKPSCYYSLLKNSLLL